MEAELTVKLRNGVSMSTPLDPLEVASMFASRYRFNDLDVETINGNVCITASGPGKSITVKRPTTELAVERLLEVFSQ